MNHSFDTDKAIEMHKKGMKYKDISEILNVNVSTLKMFFAKEAKKGTIKKRKERRFVRKNLRDLRIEKNLSQKNVADLIGVTRECITKIENCSRNPSFELSRKIKKALEYYNDDLFDIYKIKEKI